MEFEIWIYNVQAKCQTRIDKYNKTGLKQFNYSYLKLLLLFLVLKCGIIFFNEIFTLTS